MLWILTTTVDNLPPPAGPLPEPSREQIGDFYVRLGMVVAAWQMIEAWLITIYGTAIKANHENALAASFHAPSSFRVRLDMTDEAIRHCGASAELQQLWRKLYDRTVKKSKRRNEIAHAVVLFDPRREKAHEQLFLAPHLSNPSRSTGSLKPGEIIPQADIEALIPAFEQLHADLVSFQTKLRDEKRDSS